MKWVKERPTNDGFYWVFFSGLFNIHHQGPMVVEVSIDDGDLLVTDIGGDNPMTLAEYEYHNEIDAIMWSNDPIIPPPDIQGNFKKFASKDKDETE